MDKKTKSILGKFDCAYDLFEKGTNPEIVENAYHEALKVGKKEGWYPALLVADEYVEEWLCDIQQSDETDREKWIANCSNNGKSILQKRYKEYLEYYGEDEIKGFIGDEEEGQVINSFTGYISFKTPEEIEEEVILLKIPVKNPWEIIAWLPLGGWNECPDVEEMMAITKYWYENYGAIPAVFTHDVMEFYVANPVNEEKALELAKEHFAFCVDRVDQGTQSGTLSEIAVGLPDSHVWYFWWD